MNSYTPTINYSGILGGIVFGSVTRIRYRSEALGEADEGLYGPPAVAD